MHRVLRPGGTVAFTIWKSVGWWASTAAAIARIPGAPALPSFAAFSNKFDVDYAPGGDWIDPAYFEARVREAGFAPDSVRSELRENTTRNASAEEHVAVYAPMNRAMMGRFWNAEECARVTPHFDDALLGAVKEMYGDGEVVLKWEAYCITAKKTAA